VEKTAKVRGKEKKWRGSGRRGGSVGENKPDDRKGTVGVFCFFFSTMRLFPI